MTRINVLKSPPKLKSPILIEGLPGVGNIGRVAIGYMIKELNAVKFADMYSKHFFPFVMIEDRNKVALLKNEMYYWKAKKKGQRDIIFLTGDCQSLSPNGHYEVMGVILDYMEKLGVKDIITVGGLATGEMEKHPEVLGAVTHEELLKKYKDAGIKFIAGERVGYVVGAAGLLLGLGMERGMKGIVILGETSGFPIVTDPKSAEIVLNSLTKILNIKLDMKRLDERVKEMEKFIKKVESLQRKAISEISKDEKAPIKGKEQLRYIG